MSTRHHSEWDTEDGRIPTPTKTLEHLSTTRAEKKRLGICINAPLHGGPSSRGLVHGPVIGSGVRCQRCIDVTVWREDGDYHESPVINLHGVNTRTRTVYAVRECANPGAIVHEMGHLFATNRPIGKAREWDWFGWEIAMARVARCFRVWSTWMESYVMGYFDGKISGDYDDNIDGEEWGNLWPDQRRAIIADRLRFARKQGLIGRDGRPRPYDARKREIA